MNKQDLESLKDEVISIVQEYARTANADPAKIPELIHETARALTAEFYHGSDLEHSLQNGAPVPAAPIRKSVTPDYIICLEDGKKFKMMRGHLSTKYGMTPDEYRKKWGLPPEYPMTAPNFSKVLIERSKKSHLGKHSRVQDVSSKGRSSNTKGE